MERLALDPRVRGTLAHRLLEELDFAAPAAPSSQAVLQIATEEGAEPSLEEVEDVRALVAAFGESPLCARLAVARDVRREAAFAFALDAPAVGPLVTGFLDVVATEADGSILVVDYKSDRLGGADPAEAVARDYSTQQAVYGLAGLRDGAPRVEVAYCFLEQPERVVSAVFTDAAALAEELAGKAAGVLNEDWSVSPDPHRELCADCPGRARLCVHPEDLTLRAYATARDAAPGGAQTSLASLTGSGGPS